MDNPSEAANNCFSAAGIYAAFVVATSVLILRNNKRNRDAQSHRDAEGSTGAEMSGITKEFGSRGGGYGRSVAIYSDTNGAVICARSCRCCQNAGMAQSISLLVALLHSHDSLSAPPT